MRVNGARGIRVRLVTAVGGEGSEIVLPDQQAAGLFKPGGVEFTGQMPDSPDLEGIEHRIVPETVAINLPPGGKPRVETGRDEPHREDADFGGQVRVQRGSPAVHRMAVRDRDIHVRHLAAGVYPGIGAPGTMHNDSFPSAKPGESRFQPILHGFAVRLALPPPECAPVVSDGQTQTARPGFDAHRNATPSR